jgi:hypothetical protein
MKQTHVEKKYYNRAGDATQRPAGGAMTLAERARFDAATELENSIQRNIALSEALAVIIWATETNGDSLMSESAMDGLMALATNEGAGLREAFERLSIANRTEQEGARS